MFFPVIVVVVVVRIFFILPLKCELQLHFTPKCSFFVVVAVVVLLHFNVGVVLNWLLVFVKMYF